MCKSLQEATVVAIDVVAIDEWSIAVLAIGWSDHAVVTIASISWSTIAVWIVGVSSIGVSSVCWGRIERCVWCSVSWSMWHGWWVEV